VLDDFSVRVESEYIDSRSFLSRPIEVTHMHECVVAVDGDAFNFT
jgi:hypothetical protein